MAPLAIIVNGPLGPFVFRVLAALGSAEFEVFVSKGTYSWQRTEPEFP